MENLTQIFGKIRPQIFLALVGLIVIAILSIRAAQNEISVG